MPWIETIPLPVRGLSLLFCFFILILHFFLFVNGFFPFFGVLLSGIQGVYVIDLFILAILRFTRMTNKRS